MIWLCWFFHRWGKWELIPSDSPYVYQRRQCERCNLIEKRVA